MANRTDAKPAEITRKHQAHLRKDELQTRWLLAGFGGVMLLMIAILVIGALHSFVYRVYDPMGTVYGETITVGQYQQEFRYELWNSMDSLQVNINDAKAAGQSMLAVTYYSQATSLWTAYTTSTNYQQGVLNFLADAIIAKHEAAQRGITVSDEEVTADIQKNFYFSPPAMLTAIPLFTATPTDTLMPSSTPGGPTALPSLTPTLTPTATAGVEVTAVPTLVPTIQTEDMYRNNYTQFLARLKEKTGMTEADYRERIRTGLLIEKVKAAVVATMPLQQPQVHLQQIILTSELTATAAKKRLDNGEDWVVVARETSTDATNKDLAGDVGWKPLINIDAAVEPQIAALKIGEVTAPIRRDMTDGTYWYIYRVVETGEAILDGPNLQLAQGSYYSDWVTRNRNDKSIVNLFSIPKDVIPTDALPTP